MSEARSSSTFTINGKPIAARALTRLYASGSEGQFVHWNRRPMIHSSQLLHLHW